MKCLALDVAIVIEISILIAIYHLQDTLKVIINGDFLDIVVSLLSKISAIVRFPDITLEFDSNLEHIFVLIDHHQEHVHDLCLHIEDSLTMYNQIPLKIMTTTLKRFQSCAKKLQLTFIPLN